jgi:uncharacterized protein YecE (DUF72 family)
MARHWVGTSGWSYDGWRGPFYPRTLRRTDWLAQYAETFKSVEINASFYHLPKLAVLEGWAAHTPADFLFAVKAWRAITHYRRLAGCADHLRVFYERLAALGSKAGPVLFQMPPRFGVDLPRLAEFLAQLPPGRRHAFEFRDPSWHDDAVYALLARHNAAFCVYELGKARSPRVVTADFVYVRLHGRGARYRGNYGAAALRGWAEWLARAMAEERDAYVYFDNTDEKDYARRNARALDAMLARTPSCTGRQSNLRPIGARFPLPASPDRR